ncbi:MAG: ferrochelatase [Deltaproteobacteria bacterium]|nr:ferrochelatase [Deltaproteobacteria bacterium]
MASTSLDSERKPRRVCVFLMQLGGPETLADIEPFLVNLLEDVLPAPDWLRPRLARFIAKRRTPKVTPIYRRLGGGSPLCDNTEAQAAALQARLVASGVEAEVLVAMRYAPPRVAEALAHARLTSSEATWVALPLYPQYSCATSKSSLDELGRELTIPEATRLVTVSAYPTDSGYVAAQAECVEEGLARFGAGRADVQVVFSAHSLPMALVRGGDPYPSHVEQTVAAVLSRLERPPPHHLAFQSRVGPARWLGPSTIETVKKLGNDGVKRLLVVPLSFVSDHIETLYELDVELKAVAHRAGVARFERAPVVGVRPAFIDALAGIVIHALPRDSVPA